MTLLKLTNEQKNELEKKHYGIIGNHSAVQICDWAKRSLRGTDECYKHWFYGVDTYNCVQMSPNALWCDQNCSFCWRPTEYMNMKTLEEYNFDNIDDIIKGSVEQRNKLIIGFRGFDKIDKTKLEKALSEFPSHWAISLSGEPTLFPKLGELVSEIKNRGAISVFIVTNGQHPEVIANLEKTNSLPTQLYVSLESYDLESYKKINKGIHADGFEKLKETLLLLKDLPTRTVIRLTLIKDINTSEEALKELAELVEMSQADFVEIKSYMWLGNSRQRLKQENMPKHEEIKEYCKTLEKHFPSFKFEDERAISRIILYKNTGKNRSKPVPSRWIKKI
jgi:tRNA wybutosine-synthesizing protein 1